MKKHKTCPSSVTTTSEFTNGASSEMKVHLQQCSRCASDWASMQELVKMGRELPDGIPSSARIESNRNAILAGLEAQKNSNELKQIPKVRVWAMGAIAASILLGFGGYIIYSSTIHDKKKVEIAQTVRSEVFPHKDTNYFRVGYQPDEIIRLKEGTVTIKVEPLTIGERFRVVIGDAEIAVKGTIFDVTAKDDRLVSVKVISGKVEVSIEGTKPVSLGPGTQWNRKETKPTLIEEQSSVINKSEPMWENSRSSVKPTTIDRNLVENQAIRKAVRDNIQDREESMQTKEQSLSASLAEKAFSRGWNVFRGGSHLAAAREFEEAIRLAGSDPIAEDASFWAAVSFARAGQTSKSVNAFKYFLVHFPGSPRIGEASVMLGWKLFEMGQLDTAEIYFRNAINDRVTEVSNSAYKGLRAIDLSRIGK